LVRSYAKLQQMIKDNERHTVTYWLKLIQEVLVELEGEVDVRQPITFEEFQKWARAIGVRKGWVKE
jgi:hypothetical protein